MRFFYDNFPAILLAAITGTLAWIFGGTRTDMVVCTVPWLLLFLTEVLFLFPQKRLGESTYDARERAWHNMKHDPLSWTVFAFLFLLAIPFLNDGLCVSCDRALIAQGHSPEPPIPFLPFCVNRYQHLSVFLWFAAALAAALATRHCLIKEGKRMLVKMIVWNGFALAILGFVQTACGAPGPLWIEMTNVKDAGTFFSTFGYPNMAGDYFTTLFGLSAGLWRLSCDEVDEKLRTSDAAKTMLPSQLFRLRHLYLLPSAVFFFAAVSTLSRAAMILVTTLLGIVFVHTFLSFTHKMHRSEKVRKGTLALAVVGLSTFFAIISLPEEVQREVDTLDTDAVLTRVTGKGQYHTRVATAVWGDHWLFGCGGWGYKHFCVPKMTPEELKQLQMVGGINVHNDHLQFLAEHGVVGFGLLVAIVWMLLAPLARSWRELAKSVRFLDKKKAPARPTALFALPAPAFFILLTAIATFIHGFGDCPMRSPAVLSLFFVSLASITGFLPEEEHHHAAR